MANDSKTPFSNYKSAALPAELCRRFHTKAVFSELIKSSSGRGVSIKMTLSRNEKLTAFLELESVIRARSRKYWLLAKNYNVEAAPHH